MGAHLSRGTRLALWAIGVFLALGAALWRSNIFAARVTVRWSYDYSPQPACTESQKTSCIDHFEILDYSNPEDPKLLRSVPNPTKPVGKVAKFSDTFLYGPPFGLRTIIVVAVGRDKEGMRVTSNPYAAREDVKIRLRFLAH